MNKKVLSKLAAIGLSILLPISAQAEVLIILPEKGAMALAAESVRDGIQAAYYAGKYQPTLRFVDNSERSISDILKNEVKKSTQLVIGPLSREEVEVLIQSKPKVKTLALNQVYKTSPNVWQFALSPDEDAMALTKRIQADGVTDLIVLTQDSRNSSTARFRDAMNRIWGAKLVDRATLPSKVFEQQGILLLGDYDWINTFKKLPQQRIYTVPLVIRANATLPTGLQFCDIPALYKSDWPELLKSYQQKQVTVPYQRLLAFGADAWVIASGIATDNKAQKIAGRTGQISVIDNVIQRQPSCMKVKSTGLSFY